jgi:hypothetical protein
VGVYRYCTVLRIAICTAHLRLQHSFILPDCIFLSVHTVLHTVLHPVYNVSLEKYNQFTSSPCGVYFSFHNMRMTQLKRNYPPRQCRLRTPPICIVHQILRQLDSLRINSLLIQIWCCSRSEPDQGPNVLAGRIWIPNKI